MPNWQERITRETEPAIRVEHDLRYRMAEPLILGARTWADLGCGTGIAAAAALGGAYDGRAVLTDRDAPAVEQAARELRIAQTDTLVADLTVADDLDRVRALLVAGDAPRTVTCFEVIEHLATFVPLLELLLALAADHETTVLLSVPNDEFWAIENPHHATMWGEGAFEELRRLLPADAVVARQVALAGSGVVIGDAARRESVEVAIEAGVPTHFLAAFGPRAADATPVAAVGQIDANGQRAWVRQRESDLAFAEAQLLELKAWAREQTAEMDRWRVYIHELEGRLGLPPSGREAADAGQPATAPGS